MSNVGQKERETQRRVVQFFKDELNYHYLGNWEHRESNRNIESKILNKWLKDRDIENSLRKRVLRQLDIAAAMGGGRKLFDANKDVYRLLRYGVKEKAGAGEPVQTVWLIDWTHPENNHFAIAEEVTVVGGQTKRPDLVLYVNGIALGVIELKRASVNVAEGIQQNLDNQKKAFIRDFFSTMQLVMAANETQGVRYGTIETIEKYYLKWQEPVNSPLSSSESSESLLLQHLRQICSQDRFLELIHDFIVFDAGVKKTCRHNQYFGVLAAQEYIDKHKDGIIWHTQGSGKSLTMVWLAKWIREHVTDPRVLIVTDRTELDEQIEKVFNGVEEDIYRTTSGEDLIATLNEYNPWLFCSLVHKFGFNGEDDTEKERDKATQDYIDELTRKIPVDFVAKGNLYVFVDECHRTQSGKLHEAMKKILPDAMFIGFTGTPLMKKDKKKSLEVFGPFIHTYKYDEAVSDGVVLDLRYEARDIDQNLTSQKKIDQWFDVKTRGLSNLAKMQLKQKWGTMQKVLSSKGRLTQIVGDILMDMETKLALKSGRGNAMLVCTSVHQACVVYEMFNQTDLAGKCAVVTSYKPVKSNIKGEETGEGLTEQLKKYNVYRKMLAEYFEQDEDEAAKRVEEFEKNVKKRFVKEPGQMRLLIVVDKLLTGFDAPSATYLYIDKSMADHNLFQAICRVNRLDGEEKEYGYIVDYKDLFRSLDKAIKDYTAEAFDGYDADDVAGLLKDRLAEAKQDLDAALEAVRTLCEPVKAPRDTIDFMHYFVGESGVESDDVELRSEKEVLRLALYQIVAKLIRAYTNLANEMLQAGYSKKQAEQIKKEVAYYEKLRDEMKHASGDYVEMKRFEPAMRHLLDMYIRAEESEVLMDFEEMGLIDLVVNGKGFDSLPAGLKDSEDAMAEAIANNVRRTIVDENPVNPNYFDRMSTLLDRIILQRREKAISYQEYLEEIQKLARQVVNPSQSSASRYPGSVDTMAKQAIYDNFGKDEVLTTKIDLAVRFTKKADWLGNRFREREIANAVREQIAGYDLDVEEVMTIIKAQKEYH